MPRSSTTISVPPWLQRAVEKGKGILSRHKTNTWSSSQVENDNPFAGRVYAPSFAHVLGPDMEHPSAHVQDAPGATESTSLSEANLRSLVASVPSKSVNNSSPILTQRAYTFHKDGETYRIVPSINPECTADNNSNLPDASVFGMYISEDEQAPVQFGRGGGPWIVEKPTAVVVDGVEVSTQMLYAHSPCLMSVKIEKYPASLTETEPDLQPGSWFRFGTMQQSDSTTDNNQTSNGSDDTKGKVETFCQLHEVKSKPVSDDCPLTS